MKRVLWILLTPALIVLILVALAQYLVFPKVSDWALSSAKTALKNEANLELNVGSTRLSFLRLSVFLNDVKVSGKIKGLADNVSADMIQVRVDPLGLLLGQIRISAIVIDGAVIKINLDDLPKDDSPKPLPINELFKWTDKIPIERLAFRRSQLNLESPRNKMAAQLKPLDALLTNYVQKLALRFYAPSITISSSRWAEPFGMSLETLMTLESQKLTVQSAQLMALGQTIRLQGELVDPSMAFIKPQGKADLKMSSDLAPLGEKIKTFYKDTPELQGLVHVESVFSFKGTNSYEGRANVETREVKIGKFDAGSMKAEGSLQGQVLSLSEVSLTHNAGIARLTKNTIKLAAPYEFTTTLDVEQLDVQKLLVALGLKKVPVWLTAKGKLPCEGKIQNFELSCSGTVDAQNLKVRAGISSEEKMIVEIEKGHIEGNLFVDLEKVKLKTTLRFGDDVGQVNGEVAYKKGFKFDFKSDSLDFRQIKDLAGLDFKGRTSLQGSTQGDSDAATLEINLQTRNFNFEKYFLGDVAGIVAYERGHVLINKIEGVLPSTVYQGAIDVDLHKKNISGNISIPKTDLKDLAQVFSGVYKIPVDVNGPGSAEAEFSGPFDFWKMSYRLKSQFKNGQIQGESFTAADFNVRSTDGLIKTEQVEIRKSISTLKVSGTIQPDRQAQLSIDGTNWRMEESEFVNRIKNNLLGALNFNAKVNGLITSPSLEARGHLAELVVDEQEIPSSFFEFRLSKELFEGEANLFGNKIQADFKLPLGDKAGMRFRARTTDWNFSTALSLAGASQLQQEYESLLTSEIDVSSETGDWKTLTGSVVIRNFFLKRGTLSVKNSSPMELKLNKGIMNLKNFKLSGPNTDISIEGNDFSVNDLNVRVDAESDLRLAHIFLPFLEDIGGPFTLSSTLSGTYKKPEVLGSAKIDNTFIKLKGFPHAVEKLKSDIIFSHSRILVQNIKGILAGGTVTGEGSVAIAGINDIPTNIKIKAEGLNLNFPDKVKSQGDANLTFTGRWFPFVLSGVYRVNSALFEKEFTEKSGGTNQLRESIYLPKVLKEGSFDPIILDIQVLLDRNVLVKNSTMDGSVNGSIQIKGAPNLPVILGKINIDKGSKLIFKDKIFEVGSGSATFSDTKEINPDLFLSAQARVSDYDINLLVQGPAKGPPTIRLSSVPPLADQEIVSLLALGVTSEQLDSNIGSRDQANQVGYEALNAAISSVGKDNFLQSKLGVNVQITSGFDNTKNVNVPKVTFTKKITRKWSTNVSAGIGTGQGSKEVKVQYQMNNNWSAVGSWEGQELQEGTSVNNVTKESQSVFGLDLEFKREFK
jgi:translocation and assembly module TamB